MVQPEPRWSYSNIAVVKTQWGSNAIYLISAYFPPNRTATLQVLKDLEVVMDELAEELIILAGDFNATNSTTMRDVGGTGGLGSNNRQLLVRNWLANHGLEDPFNSVYTPPSKGWIGTTSLTGILTTVGVGGWTGSIPTLNCLTSCPGQ